MKKTIVNIMSALVGMVIPVVLLIAGFAIGHWQLIMWGSLGIGMMIFLSLPEEMFAKPIEKIMKIFLD